jgi:uncharacterized protein
MAADTALRDPTTAAVPTPDVVADPAPLGLAAFALTTFVLSGFNAGWLNAGLESTVFGLAFFYGGLAQLLAGMWEFRRNNTFGATAFSSYGAFWLAFWGLNRFLVVPPRTPVSDVNHAVGFFLLAWAIFTLYMTVAALRTSGAVLAVFAVLTLTFLFLAIGKLAESTGIYKVGGWLGILTAILAWYASFALVTNSTWGRTVLPTWPRT